MIQWLKLYGSCEVLGFGVWVVFLNSFTFVSVWLKSTVIYSGNNSCFDKNEIMKYYFKQFTIEVEEDKGGRVRIRVEMS